MMRRLLFWLVWHVPLGRFAPWVLGLALGSRPERVIDERADDAAAGE